MNEICKTDKGAGQQQHGGMSKTTLWLLNIALVFIIVIGMKTAAPMLTQMLIILFIAIVISPIYYVLRRIRVPSWLALTLMIVAMALLFLYGINIVLTRALLDFSKKVPEYHNEICLALNDFSAWLQGQGVEVPEAIFNDAKSINASTVTGLVKDIGTRVGNFLKDSIWVLIIVSFILCELPSLPKKVKSLPWMNEATWGRLYKIVNDVRHYMSIKTAISAATGICIYIGLSIMDIDSAVLLGFLAFVLNFVPVIGSIIAAVPAVLIALVQYDPLQGVYVSLLYLAVNMVFGNILEPRLMGYGFGVSPVVVLFSLIFWGWVLGPLGMLFAVPLTMAMRGSVESILRETMQDA